MGLQVHAYLDDLLVVASSPEEVKTAVNAVVHQFIRAGFILNLEKSDPIPTQDLVYLGARFLTAQGLVCLPIIRKEALLTVLRSFLQVGTYRTAVQFLSLLGLMTATIDLVLHARFHMRPLQFYVKRRWRASLGFQRRILITSPLPPLLGWWLEESNLDRGIPLTPPSPQWI
jgi:hypothetical protein